MNLEKITNMSPVNSIDQIKASEHDHAGLNLVTILLIILIEGFVTISVEMLSIRQLIPVVGNSVIITSLIIGVFLLFLAFGYHRGGYYRDNFRKILKRNFTIAAVLLGFGLSYLFIHFFFSFSFQLSSSHPLIVLTVYLLLIIAPLVYILGQTVPITTNLFQHEHHIGAISGKVLGLSTLGSFLGSILTTLLLMNFFGVAATVFFNYLLLCLLATLLITRFQNDWFRLFLLMLIGILVYAVNNGLEKNVFVKTNNYADYQVIKNLTYQNQPATMLSINDSPSSLVTQNRQAFEYIELIKRILFQDLQMQNKDILVLGAGGFTLSAAGDYGNHFTYVDVDQNIPDIVKRGGFIDTIKGQFIGEDARQFLLSNKKKFDAIISDVYSNRYAIPFHLLTKEYFDGIKNALNKNGVAIFNIIASPTLHTNYSKRIDNTIRASFSNCMAIPLQYSTDLTNIIYICSTMTEPKPDTKIYTDNLNSAPLDFFRK